MRLSVSIEHVYVGSWHDTCPDIAARAHIAGREPSQRGSPAGGRACGLGYQTYLRLSIIRYDLVGHLLGIYPP